MDALEMATTEDLPKGSLRTACGRLVEDDGHGRLMAALDEAYEMHNDRVSVSITGRAPFDLKLGGHVHGDGRIHLAADIDILPGGKVRPSRMNLDDAIAWCGSHTVDGVRTEKFRIDGHATRITFADPVSQIPAYEK